MHPPSTNNLQLIYSAAKAERKFWPPILRKALARQWKKTLIDDRNGLISGLPLSIFSSSKNQPKGAKQKANSLGAANLYLWTAANLQDDLCDEPNTPKYNVPLANACLTISSRLLGIEDSPFFNELSIRADTANFRELVSPLKAPKTTLSAADKSSFLLLAPLTLVRYLHWSSQDMHKLEQALSYFLACKQLADDVYDYRDDWIKGRRTYAHRNLKKLPIGDEIHTYFIQQAKKILALAAKSKEVIITISALHDEDCLDVYLEPIKLNCQRSLAKLSHRAPQV